MSDLLPFLSPRVPRTLLLLIILTAKEAKKNRTAVRPVKSREIM